jgi:hypothetical protein
MTFPLSGQASATPDIMGNERRLFFARGALLIPIGFDSVARPLPGYVCRPGHIFSSSLAGVFPYRSNVESGYASFDSKCRDESQ